MYFDEKGPRTVYCIDLDNTLTRGEYYWKEEPTPNWPMIERTRALYGDGNVVIIWTARQWLYAPETAAWLTKYSVPYHGLKMEKGGCDHLIDDKSISIREFMGMGDASGQHTPEQRNTKTSQDDDPRAID